MWHSQTLTHYSLPSAHLRRWGEAGDWKEPLLSSCAQYSLQPLCACRFPLKLSSFFQLPLHQQAFPRFVSHHCAMLWARCQLKGPPCWSNQSSSLRPVGPLPLRRQEVLKDRRLGHLSGKLWSGVETRESHPKPQHLSSKSGKLLASVCSCFDINTEINT